MFREILRQAWGALGRNPTRSLLTMMGIVWGIISVTLLLAKSWLFRQTFNCLKSCIAGLTSPELIMEH